MILINTNFVTKSFIWFSIHNAEWFFLNSFKILGNHETIETKQPSAIVFLNTRFYHQIWGLKLERIYCKTALLNQLKEWSVVKLWISSFNIHLINGLQLISTVERGVLKHV